MKGNFLDKAVAFINPVLGQRRMESRLKMDWYDRQETKRRSFEAAQKNRFSTGFYGLSTSPNQEIHQALVFLRNRARQLERNNEYAANISKIIPNNVVGTGIIPNISINGKKTGKTDKIKSIWKNWAEDTIADVDGRCTLYGLQHLAMRTVVVSGECLLVRVRKSSDFNVPLQVMMLEGDFIDTTKYEPNMPDGGCILYGIHFNKDRSRRGYWLYDKHPNEFAMVSHFVKAEDVIHIYDIERPGQYRGLPFAKSSMVRINDLGDYEFAERVRAKVAASFTAFVTGNDTDDELTPDDMDTMEPNAIVRIKNGESVHFSSPPLTQGYDSFTRSNLRAIAAGNGVTYEAMTGDYSQVNFSSGRMGWIEFSRNVQHWQWNVMIPHFSKVVFRWFTEACQMAGHISFRDVLTADWTAPRREMIDPKKETDARIAAVDAGLTTRQEILREDGYNPEDVYKELGEDKEMQEKYGLNLSGQKQQIGGADNMDDSRPSQNDLQE